jgi:hypothetical protein
MMEAARPSETTVNFHQTSRRYIPEDSHLRIHRRENLKSYSKIRWDFRFSRRRVWIWLSSGMLHRVVLHKLTDVSEVFTALSVLMMEAVGPSETSVNFYETTRRNIPEDSSGWIICTEENRRSSPSATSFTTNPTWTALGAKPDLRGENPATNRLSYGTAENVA